VCFAFCFLLFRFSSSFLYRLIPRYFSHPSLFPFNRRLLLCGGDDITVLWHNLLKESAFPFADCNLALTYDFECLNRLKEQMCTFDEFELGTRHYDLYVRRPKQSTLLYELKIYDEALKAPLGLFYPNLIGDCRLKRIQKPTISYDPEDCFNQQFLIEVPFFSCCFALLFVLPCLFDCVFFNSLRSFRPLRKGRDLPRQLLSLLRKSLPRARPHRLGRANCRLRLRAMEMWERLIKTKKARWRAERRPCRWT